jgi:hypothetical protein
MSSIIIGIDPSPLLQACVLFDVTEKRVVSVGTFKADDLPDALFKQKVAIEWIESYGMAVGQEVFRTVFQIGRMQQQLGVVRLIPRRDVKLTLCGLARAKDTNIRQALIDAIGEVGTKKNPGPLYGVSGHYWAALGVAYTASRCEPTEHEAFFHVE